MGVTWKNPVFILGTSTDTCMNTYPHSVEGLVAACCKLGVFVQSADLWLVLEGCLVSLEGSGEGMHMGWWLLVAVLVDHSTRAYGDVSKKEVFW